MYLNNYILTQDGKLYTVNNDELYHYGVKGMKWGVRRYQNSDGSLTSAGKKRAAKEEYKRSSDLAFKRYEKTINSIEKNYKRGQNLSVRDMSREDAADKRYREEVAKAKATYKDAKKQIKAENEANVKQMNRELQNVNRRHTFAANTSKFTKAAVARGAGALGVAAIGSAATLALAKSGKMKAAQSAYKLSRQTFSTLMFTANVSAGFAAMNAVMGGAGDTMNYHRSIKEVKSKYNT